MYLVGTWSELRGYVAFRLGTSGRPFNNLDDFATLSIFYVSLPYLVLIGGTGLAAVCGLLWGGRGVWPGRRALAIGVAVGAAVLVLTGSQPTWPAVVLWALALGVLVLSRDVGDAWKAAVLGAGLPLGVYAFLLGHPRTHWHELFPALALLVGAAVDRALGWLPSGPRRATLAVGTGALAVIAAYPVGTFVPIWPAGLVPEAVIDWYRPVTPPAHSSSFGLPHQDGWKAIARLEAEGRLPLPYDTNEEPAVARWYLPRAEYCRGAANSYLLADTPATQSPWSVRRAMAEETAALATVDGRPTLVVRARVPLSTEPLALPAETAVGWYDAEQAAFLRPLELEGRLCRTKPVPAWRMH